MSMLRLIILKPMISEKHLDTEAQRNNEVSLQDMNQNNNHISGLSLLPDMPSSSRRGVCHQKMHLTKNRYV